MSQPGRGDSYDDVQDEPEELVESESETDDENYEPPQSETIKALARGTWVHLMMMHFLIC